MTVGERVTSLDPRDQGATFVVVETGIAHVSGATSRVRGEFDNSTRYRLDRYLRPFVHAVDCDLDEDCSCRVSVSYDPRLDHPERYSGKHGGPI